MAASRPTAQHLGLFASLAALAAGGVALGMEVERRVVSKRLRPAAEPVEDFFGLRSDGPMVTTPDGVVLHTEVDESETDEPGLTLVLVHGYALNMDCWHFQRKHFRGRIRQVLYDQRSHGRSGRSAPEKCRIGVLSADLLQVLDEVAGDGPVVLAGHSMGGMTIMNLALTRPDCSGRASAGSPCSPRPRTRWPNTRPSGACRDGSSPGWRRPPWPR